uniref:Protein kinase domain-containing protein n=1 Tax=Daphnia galeata TaxID=27404 RepID=A0A8J2SB50_9CRUS|nr:unnamed protein product [Daphnia galeata]
MKLADFGLSRSVNKRGTYTMSSGIKGTKCWYSPELLKLNNQFQRSPQGRGTVKSDVFALGLVFAYLLLDGTHLYGSNEIEINANIVANTQVYIHKIDPFHYALELIKNMLKHDDKISSDKVVIQLKSIKKKLSVAEKELRHLCTNSTSLDFEKFEILTQLAIDVYGKSIGGSNELEKAFQVILDQLVEETKKLENDPNYPSNYRRKMADVWNNFIYTLSNFPQTFQDEIVQQMIHQAAEDTKDSTLALMSFDQSFRNHLELTNSNNSEDKEVIRRQGEEPKKKMWSSGSTSSDLAKGKKFLKKLQYVQHVDKEKETASEIPEQTLQDILAVKCGL